MKTYMRQVMKTILLAGVLTLGLSRLALAFVTEGPVGNAGDNWQSPVNGFGPPRDVVAPKNIGEGYRRNTPVMYYAFDANFLDFFGTSGVAAVDSAMAILNSTFTNNPTGLINGLDGYSTGLTEFPTTSTHVNYQAQALGIYDVKSETLGLMMGQLGLADPVMYIWGIHDRYHVGNVACPIGMNYLVVQRNFDITSTPLNQLQYSPYVNNTLYSYNIFESCAPPNPEAFADAYPADPLAQVYTPVASYFNALTWGNYFNGLTRDDVAGLRYLLQTNLINKETISADSLLYTISTNFSNPQVFPPYLNSSTNVVNGTNGGYYIYTGNTNGGIGYGDLGAFISFTHTNPLANVLAAYPGLIATQLSNSWGWASNVTYSSFFTNPQPGSPYGTPPRFVVVTNYTPVFQFYYYYSFGNVFTNHYYTNSSGFWQTAKASAPIGSPYGTPAITNTTVQFTNQIAGDFFVLSPFYTNFCPLDIVSPPILTAQATTNYLTGGTTNTGTTSISNSVSIVTYYTNYSYVIYPVTCTETAGATGLYEGIEKLQFVKSSYDSLIGQYFQPITNNYTMTAITNSQTQLMYLQRVVTTPDFLFDAQDLAPGPAALPPLEVIESVQSPDFYQANVLPGLAGPGTIISPTTFTLNKVGPTFYNYQNDATNLLGSSMNGTPYFVETPGGDVNDLYYTAYFVWGSYDGSTNAPVLYPNGTSINTLQNGILIQVSPASLPIGYAGWPYTVTFTATGGSLIPPYSWSAAGLPNGLTLTSDGNLSGNPTQVGTTTFTLILTDSLSRSVQWNYTITIQ